MATRKIFIHRDILWGAALVRAAGGAADRHLEDEVEKHEALKFNEEDRGKLLTLLTEQLSV